MRASTSIQRPIATVGVSLVLGGMGLALYSSPDLRGWRFERWLVKSSELPEDCPCRRRFWAPEIHKIGDAGAESSFTFCPASFTIVRLAPDQPN
jgi:hypothetical protein